MTEPIQLGRARVDLIPEVEFPEGPPHELLTALPTDAVEANLDWFAPRYYDAQREQMISSVHVWVVRVDGRTIVIDTGNGNDKPRPQFPVISMLHTSFLERLAAIGISLEDVDVVICTHLHLDHVGWNTVAVDGAWQPTFPRARYLFPRADFDHWDPESGPGRDDPINQNVFKDSILPVFDAGLAELIDPVYEVADGVTINPAPGHSPGHSVVRVTSDGVTGVFFGDLMHSPLQVRYPESNSIFCLDQDEASASRQRILRAAAEGGHLLFSAHFPTPQAGRVETSGTAYIWRPLE
jgi:glyoxylase-like metal-dependent hydrolase (beta-lactamase superfamily II)